MLPEPVAAQVAAAGEKGASIPVSVGTVAAGDLQVRLVAGGYESVGGWAALPLHYAVFAPLERFGVVPVVAVNIAKGAVEGRASIARNGRPLVGEKALLDAVVDHAAALGWHGLDGLKMDGIENALRGPTLVLRAGGLSFRIGQFLAGSGTFGVEDAAVTFQAHATGRVGQVATVELDLARGADGALTGRGVGNLAMRGFTGQLTAAFAGGAVDVQGVVTYADERFSGQVTLVATDAASAKALTDARMPAQAMPAAAAAAGPAVAPVGPAQAAPAPAGPKPGPRVIAGWGTVRIRLADWLSGEALVVVDHQGDITVVGSITPKMDKPLFEQKPFRLDLPAPRIKALYGIPLVGNVSVFVQVRPAAVAWIGPATLDHMALNGTYSTKPEVLKNFGLTGTLNVSAYAGLEITVEGGAGVELVGHEVTAGVGITAVAGIKGYVEATPTIGYRELADPKAGKRGEFFVAGHLELAAQPFLGLRGELFVDLDSPFWSPAPDHRWTWPLGSLEYPLPGQFGIGADVEHVLGSGKVPEIKFSPVAFDGSKFMTDLLSEKVPPKTSSDAKKPGTWKEGAGAAAPARPAKPDATAGATAKPAVGKPADEPAVAKKDVGKVPTRDPAAQKRWNEGKEALADLARRSHENPQDEKEIRASLAAIKKDKGFTTLTPRREGSKWSVDAAMSPVEKDVAEIDAESSGIPGGSSVPPGYTIKKVSFTSSDPDFWDRPGADTDVVPQPKVAIEMPGGVRAWRDRVGGPVRHEAPLGAAVARAGQEKEHFTASEHGNLAAGPKYERAHTLGAGTGFESPYAIYYAPRVVNQDLQNQGIEAYMRSLATGPPPGHQYRVITSTSTIPDTRRLGGVAYRLQAVVDGRVHDVASYEIQITGSKDHPRVKATQLRFADNPMAAGVRERVPVPAILLSSFDKTL
ncbi:polymorphic toxin type 4 domain-containing protein [Actinomycetospora lemnae]|uniref:Polymorphic toxin type 4 domain-containing protein n=1 Tax=Actinomycetospora lemnae TaxID=3019891 RepID=A0ABT5SRJ8_9PSEU|nr:polymorphic toxin type 4 domain-containing protein [Actinomycetospora sp. DW7H6]MDD7965488.1 polymorphic toxin type 4 domain-containing protein [Actinomycetospora sp. DW7H6]